MNKQTLVAILMGSDSDLGVVSETCQTLEEFGVSFEVKVLSAHRSPGLVHEYVTSLKDQGIKVIIAAAGGAAHLAGVCASLSVLPVIGIPVQAKTLDGLDSLLSTVQMPPGVPVATVGINASKNAALLALQILATSDEELSGKLEEYKKKLEKSILEKTEKLKKLGYQQYLEEKGK